MEYTKEYFINKFENIPDDMWAIGDIIKGKFIEKKKFDALGHCGVIRGNGPNQFNYIPTDEANALILLFGGKVDPNNSRTDYGVVFRINDSTDGTPKQNILNRLKQIP